MCKDSVAEKGKSLPFRMNEDVYDGGGERDESRVVGSQDTHTGHVQDLGPGPDAMRRQSSNHLNPGHKLISFVISKMPL